MNFEPILYGPLFIRDAQDINLVAASADPVNLTVSVGGSSWTIPVTPVLTNNRYLAALRMREILSSVVGIPGLANAGEREVPLVTLSAGDATMSVRAVYGAASGKTPTQLAGHWLSWRDQVSTTHAWGRERLTFLAGLDLLGWQSGTYSVNAKIFLSSGDPVTVTLASGTLQSGCRYVTVDASYATIAAAVSASVRSKIRAWDVSYSFSGTDSQSAAATINGYPLRLIIARDEVRVKEFVFCNSFGVEDRVYSSGRSNPKLDGSSVAFLSGASEYELRNDSTEGREVYSGRLGSARESALWLDFLKAHDRYILASGGLARIIVDSQETDLQDNALGSVKFTYHLGALDNGRYFNDQEGLGDYDPTQRHGALYIGDEPPSEELPSEDLFFLKTRLDEFPVADLSEEYLFLVQDPLTLEWCNAPLSDIKEWLQQVITHEDVHVWSGPWEDYSAGVAGYALAASLGKDLCDRVEALEGAPAYQLPIATDTRLGGIKVGSGLEITPEGVLSAVDACYFEPDPDYEGDISLKTAYAGLRIPGLRFGIGRTDFDLEVRNIAGEGETPVWVLYSPLPLITEGDQIVHSGTPGSGGGGGATKLWQLDDVDVPSDPLEIVDGQALLWNAATQRWVNANVVTDLSNYYTKAQTYSKTEVDGMVEDIDDAMDNLQAQIDAVSSRDMFDELIATSLYADIIAATDIYGYLHGTVDEAVKLSTSGPLGIWGVQYWNNGIPSDVAGRPNLYIGSTQVQTAGNTQPLEGISTITLVAQSTRSTSGNVIEVVTESDGQGGTITYLHTTLPIISDGDQIVGDGTPGGGSGGGAAYLHELLDVIANLAPSDGYLLAWDSYATSQAGQTGAWKAISQSSVLAPVTALIPAQASASNQLADKDFVNSSIATATATYRGSYNLVSDLGLTTAATESQIGTALASAVSDEDNNDYAFVQIPTSDDTPTEIARTDRYKYNGSAWVFEYSLNNSGYTAAQWAAINSGINTAKRQGYDAIAGYFDANGKLTPAHVGDLSATYALVSHTHTIAQVTNLQDELDALSARIDSVASRDDFDELTASVIFADIIAADIFYGNLEGNADTATDADKLDGQHGSYYATASAVSTLQDYFDASGNAKSALKLTTVSKTAWGRTFWTANGVPDSVSGDMDSVGKIAFTAQNAKSTTGFVLEVVTESDGQGGTITYLHTTLPIISDGDQIVGTGTPGGGGGGGASKLWQLDDVNVPSDPSAITDGQALVWNASQERWVNAAVITDLSNYYTKAETYSQAEVNALIGAIDQFHYEIAASTSAVVDPQSNVLYLIGPTGSGADKYEEYVYTNSTWTKIGDTSIDLSNYYTKSETYSKTEVDTALNGYVPTTRTVSGTGYLTGGGALSQNQTLDIASAVKTKIDHGESAYSALPDINALLDNLQAQVDAVSSRDCYDELTATVFYSDIVAATDIYGALHGDADNALNLEGHAASYFATASAVTTLQGYFDNSGNAKTALKLTTSGPLNIWGVQYWNSGVPSAVTGRPSFGAGADVPAGQTFKIGDATFSWVAGSNGNPGYLYVDTAFMSAGDQIIGSGTPGQGGGGGGKNYLYELLDTAYAWDAAFPTGISEQQVLVYTPNADSKNGTGTGAWSYVPKTAVGAFYTAGTGLALSNANVFSLDVNAAKTALGLGDAAYLGVASAIGSSVTGLVSGALLYGVLGDSFDSTNTVKAFVNSSIATATATFRGTNATATTEAAFLTWANALTHDLNDYVFWQTTDSYGNTIYKRYKFDGTSWVFEYNLNNSSFTTAQWDAINSGITSTKRSGYDTIVGYFTNGQLQAAHVGDLSGTYLPKSGGSMNNTTVVTNLNADLLDGKHANEFAAATHSHTISQVTNLESNLDTLSGRIDAIGSRNMFDELSASVFFSDIVTASTAYIESIVGSLTGTASNASQLEGHAASYFATASSLNSYLLLSGGTMTGTLTMKANQYNDAYAGALNMNNSNIYGLNSIYTADVSDDQSEGIHFYRDSTHVDSLRMANGSLLFTPNRPLDGTATEYTVYHSGNSNKSDASWRCDNLVAACVELIPPSGANHGGFIDFHYGGSSADYTTRLIEWTSGRLTCEGNFHVNGTFTSSGDQTISSDEALKMNLEDIRLSAKDIAGVRAVTFDWKDGRGRSFGTIAQDWLGILPEAVSGEEGNYSVAYAQAAMVAAVVNSREIVKIEKHETEQDKEIRELKAALGKANGRIADLEKEVERLRMN